ncbi:RING-type domain-containing protein [Favolaschia claudopus]|uniref:RING-type domain-containing protein n=1 Tax=Favolaschia claudopus TaxID=2862362 RepID=A0AAW0EEN3_9AGAR
MSESDLDSLRSSIPEILALARLSGVFSRVGVLAYKDYTEPDELIAWSGWNSDSALARFVQDLEPTGGGDFPEAAKTALIRALQAVDKESKTLILWYADAPPHHMSVQSLGNDVAETKAFPTGAVDWVKLSHTARRRNCTVFTFTPNSMDIAHASFYILLSELTGGVSISSKAGAKSAEVISRLTLGVILQWIGQSTTNMEDVLRDSGALLLRYEESPRTATSKPKDEESGSAGYLPPSLKSSNGTPLRRILSIALDISHLSSTASEMVPLDLSKRFDDVAQTGYRSLAYQSLEDIIKLNVASLTYNSIFGQLWRAVCRDPSERRTHLVDAFSDAVGKITDFEKRAALRQWLEESFDRTAEIEQIIMRHRTAEGGESASLYLDLDADVRLTRTELLDVSRSCYSAVLKKIANIFTHLKLAESNTHLLPGQRSIPLTLPPRDLFRILPHLIVPGTLYPTRAASLTAILALTTGVPFLRDSTTALLEPTKGTWLDMQVPENISFDCAKLLLSAPPGLVLNAKEKRVYEGMRRYQLVEDLSLEVTVPWTPRKTRGVGDVKVQCKKCGIRRSITIMSHVHSDVCGLCVRGALSAAKLAERYPDLDDSESCWVECSRRTCRAQYVLVDIPPRCYYCRNGVACPWLECSSCSNRVIVPQKFRTATDSQAYICPACTNAALKTTVEENTTAGVLVAQNGVGWLGFSEDHKSDIFKGKSAFKLMQAFGEVVFGSGNAGVKSLFGIENLIGRGEIVLSTCSLCFEEVQSTKLVQACGRTGCNQLVDQKCLHEWYGENAPGKLLNTMQFTCPFCRRRPTIKTLSRYNRHAISLGGLQVALDDRVRFLYAWCLDCGFAKPAVERTVCTSDTDGVPALADFRCKECESSLRAVNSRIEAEEYVFLKEQKKGKMKKEQMWREVQGLRTVVCPNETCGARVNKIDGCNHMVCVCGTHLCYACGKAVAEEWIGRHAYREHGSIYDE